MLLCCILQKHVPQAPCCAHRPYSYCCSYYCPCETKLQAGKVWSQKPSYLCLERHFAANLVWYWHTHVIADILALDINIHIAALALADEPLANKTLLASCEHKTQTVAVYLDDVMVVREWMLAMQDEDCRVAGVF